MSDIASAIPAGSLLHLDGRTRYARHVRELRAQLIADLGGHATAAQRVLIDRICSLSHRVAIADAQALRGGDPGPADAYAAASAALNDALSRFQPHAGGAGVAQ